jgi:phospholipid/cholesterol/gamma-HCH transport system substrate-binding protein
MAKPSSRTLAVLAVAAAIAAVAWLLLQGDRPYTVTAYFENSSQLVEGGFVKVGGQEIGSITNIRLSDDGLAEIDMRIDRFAPLRRGTTAAIRTTSLTGVANRYIALTLGPPSGAEIPDAGTIATEKTRSVVELDQVFSAFPPRTRAGLKKIVQGGAVQYAGRSREAGEAIRYLNPALASSTAAVEQLVRDRAVFRRAVTDTADLMSALGSRHRELTDLISSANTAAAAVGDENAALGRALELLPSTMRQANTTFVDLRATLDDLDPLVAAATPATRDLAPLLTEVRPLVHEARPTIRDLAATFSAPGPSNDLTEVLDSAPRLARLTSTASSDTVRALRRAQPVIEYVRPYTTELIGWLTKFGQVPSPYDANGHYARIQPMFNAFALQQTPAGDVLVPQAPSERLAGLETRRGARCPGGAVQPPPDGSAPYRPDSAFECDPSTVLPGP